MAATSEQLSKAAEAAEKSGLFSKLGEAPKSTLGKGVQWLSYHGTTGGLRNLANSVELATDFSHAAKVSRGGTFVRAMLVPVMAPISLAGHALGGGVRAVKLGASKYGAAFKAHPWLTGLGTAAVAAPIAYHMLASEKEPKSHAREEMTAIGDMQQQTRQVQEVMAQSQPTPPVQIMPAPAPVMEQQPLPSAIAQTVQNVVPPTVDVPGKYASMQQANPQIAANSAMEMGRVDDVQLARA